MVYYNTLYLFYRQKSCNKVRISTDEKPDFSERGLSLKELNVIKSVVRNLKGIA